MRSQRWVNLYDPSPVDIELSDWVTGASRVPRWGGQVKGEISFNVLQHHDLVEQVLTGIVWPDAPREARMLAKLHDLHEGGGLGDIVTPYSALFANSGLREIKSRLDRVIFLAAGLPNDLPENVCVAVKKADMVAAISEAIQLLDWPEALARRDIGKGYRGPLWTDAILVLDERAARVAWWDGYYALGGRR